MEKEQAKQEPREREFEVISVTVDAWCRNLGSGYTVAPLESLAFGAWAPKAFRGTQLVGVVGKAVFRVWSHKGAPSLGPQTFRLEGDDVVFVDKSTTKPVEKSVEKPEEKPLVLARLEADVKDVVSQTQRDSRNSRGNKWLITLPPKERARFPVGPDIRHGGDPCLEVYSVNEPQMGPGAFELFDHKGETRVRWLGPGSGASKTPQTPFETDHSAEFRNLLRAFCLQHNIAMLETQPSELDAFQGPAKQQATAYLTDRVRKCSHCNQDEVVKAEPVRDMLFNLALNAVISIGTRRCTQLWVECRCVNTNDGVGIYEAKLWWSNRVD